MNNIQNERENVQIEIFDFGRSPMDDQVLIRVGNSGGCFLKFIYLTVPSLSWGMWHHLVWACGSSSGPGPLHWDHRVLATDPTGGCFWMSLTLHPLRIQCSLRQWGRCGWLLAITQLWNWSKSLNQFKAHLQAEGHHSALCREPQRGNRIRNVKVLVHSLSKSTQ